MGLGFWTSKYELRDQIVIVCLKNKSAVFSSMWQ